MIPYDRNDPTNYYTVELRTAHNFDRGISQASVLIHRVQKVGESYYSVLLSQARDFYELTENTEWVKFLEPNVTGNFQLIRVSVKRVYPNDADIGISTTFDPGECRLGEFRKSLLVKSRNKRIGQSGNSTKSSAHSGELEHVCIDRDRPLTDLDMQKQYARRNFYALQTTFGANACRAGNVWRSLDAYDYVCVTQKRHEIALDESSHQEERIALNGTGCAEPFLPRRAFADDDVCVTPSEKFRTFRENLQSTHMLQHFAFFNGVDTVGP
jgi:hypothetical protein